MLVEFDLNSDTPEVLINGTQVTPDARAFDVLACVDAHRHRALANAELLEEGWGGPSRVRISAPMTMP